MRWAAVLVAGALLTGCSADVAAEQATAAALQFVAAEPVQACSLLAPQTLRTFERDRGPCPSAMAGLELPRGGQVQAAEVAVQSAQVRLSDQVIFLARFGEHWLVTAAGCRQTDPDPAVPYECEVAP